MRKPPILSKKFLTFWIERGRVCSTRRGVVRELFGFLPGFPHKYKYTRTFLREKRMSIPRFP
jgi:hypothetical protein